jgi:formate dehydrogenase major subunit
MMNEKGIPVSRWFDGVLEAKENVAQPDNVKGMVFWGHAPNSQTRLPEMQEAMQKLDTLVVIDPYPTGSASCTSARMASTCCRPRRSSRPTAR